MQISGVTTTNPEKLQVSKPQASSLYASSLQHNLLLAQLPLQFFEKIKFLDNFSKNIHLTFTQILS